uniref:helix-turn-helix domain-containing protein n=1 Tax=Streptomyces sp. I05A-00742 TaxID=2732853 RepID=UPI0014876444
LGRAHRELGDDAAARPLLARARDAALTCGATGLWRSLAPAARPAAGDDVLTGAEHRVASLAARGLSNREVAAELSIAVSTVEQHLTRIYRKYRIKHRRQLRDRMAPTGA